MKKIVIFLSLVLLVTNLAWAQSKPSDLDDLPRGPRARTFAPGPAMASPNSPMKLIGADYSDAVVSYSPEDVNAVSRYTTDVLVGVDVPQNPSRTNLLLCFGGTYSWESVPSFANLRYHGRYDLALQTPAMPDVLHVSSLHDWIDEYGPTGLSATRVHDPARCLALEEKFLATSLAPKYGLTPVQAQALALSILRSNLKIEMTVVFATRSVDYLDLSWPYLQVWGD